MKEPSTSSEKKTTEETTQKQKNATKTKLTTVAKQMEKWRQDVISLSYEESLQALDLLLTKLQDESVPVEELQVYYLHGKIYLEHCEELLNKVEQNVLLFDAEKKDLIPINNKEIP